LAFEQRRQNIHLPQWMDCIKAVMSPSMGRYICLSDHYVMTWQWTSHTTAKICVCVRTGL
jgi:hypothetical protein